MSSISFNVHTTLELDASVIIPIVQIGKLQTRKFILPKWYSL